MAKSLSPWILACTLLATSGCPAPSPTITCTDAVVSEADETVDFTAIQTFIVANAEDFPEELPGDLPEDTITSIELANEAGRRELTALGLREVDPAVETPDVKLFTMAATEESQGEIWECVPGWVWWGYWNYVWDPCAWLRRVTVDYEVGTLLVGLADPDERSVVFGGAIQGALICGEVEERIDSGIAEIFAAYPSGQTGG